MGQPAFAARIIPNKIPTLEDVDMPDVVMELCRKRDGLVLFTSPTGSGKSTSLSAIIQRMLFETPLNLVTLEDPIEFRFDSHEGLVRQRELGTDFPSWRIHSTIRMPIRRPKLTRGELLFRAILPYRMKQGRLSPSSAYFKNCVA